MSSVDLCVYLILNWYHRLYQCQKWFCTVHARQSFIHRRKTWAKLRSRWGSLYFMRPRVARSRRGMFPGWKPAKLTPIRNRIWDSRHTCEYLKVCYNVHVVVGVHVANSVRLLQLFFAVDLHLCIWLSKTITLYMVRTPVTECCLCRHELANSA